MIVIILCCGYNSVLSVEDKPSPGVQADDTAMEVQTTEGWSDILVL